MFCPKCHKAMDPELPKCMYCGYLNREYDYNKDRTIDVDYPKTGLNIISMLFPFVGIILFFINDSKKPKMAKSIFIYSIFGTVVYVISFIVVHLAFKGV